MTEQSQTRQGLGKIADFPEFPAEVTIDHDSYFILREEGGEAGEAVYRLVSAICPHAGGYVRPYNGELICPLHFWSFDAVTGESTNMPGEALECQPLEVVDGELFMNKLA
ncbi:Rieske (2Fe-2S) protein [Paenibacillus sp. GCM10027626]|uniref:Rieske (2Fe-2S) protein n=1 Tax=Paenibacillus sp. GCM10027626 TaxID=3273411 RepID=UPI0036367578